MNIIIVDDEAQIRRWIELLVQNTGMSIHIAASCSNGKEALEACSVSEVDIVITDIKMPVMDGIELIRQLKKERPSVQFLILSSYSEFHYASEALKAGANDYLLKAEITAGGLKDALEKIWSEIEKERSRDREVFSLKSTLNGNQYAIRSLYFGELLKGKGSAVHEFDGKMDTLRIRLTSRNILLMAIRCDEQTDRKEPAKITDPDLLDSAVINIVDETLLTETGGGCCFVMEQGYYVAIFNYEHWKGKTLRELTLQYAHRIAGYLHDYLRLSVSIGISLPAVDITALGKQLKEASAALNHKLFYGRRSISWYSDEQASAQAAGALHGHVHLETLSAQLDREQFGPALDSLRELLRQVGEQMLWSEKEVKAFCIEAAFLVQRTLRRYHSSTGPGPSPDAEVPYEEIARLTTFEQVKNWLMSRISNDLRDVEESRHPYSEAIRKVCDYVKTHYSEEVSLQHAADYVHLNRNYLSELFKKETGVSFNDYLTHIRIDKAKELLLKDETKIGWLAEQVGYPDGSYMSKVFKKVTGMTPMEFKQRKTEKTDTV